MDANNQKIRVALIIKRLGVVFPETNLIADFEKVSKREKVLAEDDTMTEGDDEAATTLFAVFIGNLNEGLVFFLEAPDENAVEDRLNHGTLLENDEG